MAAVVLALTAGPARADGWTWPVRGAVVTGFANAGGPYAAGQHRGIDVAAPPGTAVVAAAGGEVRFAGLVGSSGLTVALRTADGAFDTSYLHLADARVEAGDVVAAGERIGSIGKSGSPSSDAPHLHFGVRDAGTRRYRDPLDLLPPRPARRDSPRGVPVTVGAPVRVGPEPVRVRPAPTRVAPAPDRVAPAPVRLEPAPVRLGRAPIHARPAPQPLAFEHFRPQPTRAGDSTAQSAPRRGGWAIACTALILAAALTGGGSRRGRRRMRAVAGRLLPSLGGR